MKHIFVIHSHTSFLTAMGTIDFLKLNESDVAIAWSRNYRNILYDKNYKSSDIGWTAEYPAFKKLFSHRRDFQRIDSQIDYMTEGEDYILYAPHPSASQFQLLLTNPKCVGFNYIQEGALILKGMFLKRDWGLLYRIKNRIYRFLYENRLYGARLTWDVPKFKKLLKEPECYAITDDIFDGSNYKQNLIKWPAYNIPEEYAINPSFPCFITESFIEKDVVEKEIYLGLYKELVDTMGRAENYVKFHPAQWEVTKTEIIQLFENSGKKVKVLPDDFPFEVYLSSYKNMTVCGFRSSLVVFAGQLGHTSYSMENKLRMESTKYNNWRENLELTKIG